MICCYLVLRSDNIHFIYVYMKTYLSGIIQWGYSRLHCSHKKSENFTEIWTIILQKTFTLIENPFTKLNWILLQKTITSYLKLMMIFLLKQLNRKFDKLLIFHNTFQFFCESIYGYSTSDWFLKSDGDPFNCLLYYYSFLNSILVPQIYTVTLKYFRSRCTFF